MPALPPPRSRTTSAPPARTAPISTSLAALALALAACSGSSSSSPQSGPSSSATVGGGTVASTVVLGSVAGAVQEPGHRIFVKHRKSVLTQVGKVVDTWIDGGFVGVDYPASSFPDAFTAFTKPAARDAEKQQRLTTNWALRNKIDGVSVKKRRVVVDVLAPRGRPAGATARVTLVFTTTGDTQKRVTVHGRLFLNPAGHGS